MPLTAGTARHERAVALANAHAGVISRAELAADGWSPQMIRSQLDAGRWRNMLRGVYSTTTGDQSIHAWWWAATLYAGNDALLCSESAAQAWGLLPASLPVHIATPSARKITPVAGIVKVSLRQATAARVEPDKCPAAQTIENALLDTTAKLPLGAACDLIRTACTRWKTNPQALRRELDRRDRYPRRKALNALFDELADGVTSDLEAPLLSKVLRPHGLPPGRGQVRQQSGSKTVLRDRVLNEFGTLIETDGRLGHADATGRFRDMDRDNEASLSRWLTLRFGYDDVHERPCEAAFQVIRGIRPRGWTGQAQACGQHCRLPQLLLGAEMD